MENWECSGCGKNLPKQGRIWKWRYEKYSGMGNSGYYCDSCADKREAGIDG